MLTSVGQAWFAGLGFGGWLIQLGSVLGLSGWICKVGEVGTDWSF